MMSSIRNICSLTVLFGLCFNTCLSSCIHLANETLCYSDNNSNPIRFYGTKTTYTIARQTFRNDSFNGEIPDCKPIMFYFVGRHAIRYPDGEDIVEMSQVLPQLQQNIISAAQKGLTQLCLQDLEAIRDWKLRMNESDDNRISETGSIETKTIAKEFMDRYPSLFNINKVKIDVGITTKERTLQTADAFLQQIQLNQNNYYKEKDERSSEESGEKHDKHTTVNEITKSEKPFLYFHDTCEELLSQQGVKLEKPKLVKDLRQSHFMRKLIQSVNHRLGLRSNNLINAKILKHVIRACHFEFAIHGSSPWCSALGPEELKILEYLDDIEDYYEDAYGRNINGEQTCPLVGDLLNKVKLSVKSHKDKKTYLHFTHAGVIKRLYAGLGLFNDLHSDISSKSDEAICLSDNRKWKSSLVSPFSANFAAVLHKCKHKSKNDDQKYGKYKLLTLVQQNPVIIDGCDSALCSVDKFFESYNKMSSNCDLNQICKI